MGGIILYILFSQLPKWILGKKYRELETGFSWKIPIMKLTGLTLGLLLAFLLVFGITLSTEKKFIENKNTIYGLEFNTAMEGFGFQDSMKIISVNGQTINLVNEIVVEILYASGDVEVAIEKDGISDIVVIPETDKMDVFMNSEGIPILPIMHSPNGDNKIVVSTQSNELSDVLDRISALWRQAMLVLNPSPAAYKGMGGFIALSPESLKGALMMLSSQLVFFGILNMLPAPGFGVGNFLISIVETMRKKLFNRKIKLTIKAVSILAVVAVFILSVYF